MAIEKCSADSSLWIYQLFLRIGGHLALTDFHLEDPSELSHMALITLLYRPGIIIITIIIIIIVVVVVVFVVVVVVVVAVLLLHVLSFMLYSVLQLCA